MTANTKLLTDKSLFWRSILVPKHCLFAASVGMLVLVSPAAGKVAVTMAAPATSVAASSPAMPTHYGKWGFDVSGMDRSVRPGDDWFSFVNGTWVKKTVIPSDKSSYGAFAVLRDLSELRLRQLLTSYRSDDTAHPDRMKAAILYQGFMNEAAAEKLDAQPLASRLAPIRAAATKIDVGRLMGHSIGGFGASFFGPGISDDANN